MILLYKQKSNWIPIFLKTNPDPTSKINEQISRIIGFKKGEINSQQKRGILESA
jgi:hypothetical protein